MDEYMGIIKIFAGTFAPRGWAFCDGQILQISQYNALFSLLGTTYGGNGATTFALPDLRSRVPIHAGQGAGPELSSYDIGQMSGTEHNSLTIGNLPAHTHPVSASFSANNGEASQSTVTPNAAIATPGVKVGRTFNPTFGFNTATPNTAVSGLSVTVGITGNSLPVNNIQPILGVNYIICLEGIYPSRS